eukprot:gene25243-4351_t
MPARPSLTPTWAPAPPVTVLVALRLALGVAELRVAHLLSFVADAVPFPVTVVRVE